VAVLRHDPKATMRKLMRPILILLAIIFLIEAWLWDKLEPIVERIVRLIPLRRIKDAIAHWVSKLPPAATLLVFAVPMALSVPFKVLGLWFLASGQFIAAASVLVTAKFVTLGITAFIFDVTREKLLQLAWFRFIYDYVLLLRAKANALVEPIKRRIRYRMRLLMPGNSKRAFRLLSRIRRRMHLAQPAE
jgi:hypothetical protein